MIIDDIIEFVKNWRASHGYESGEVLSLEQMEVFIGDLQKHHGILSGTNHRWLAQ